MKTSASLEAVRAGALLAALLPVPAALSGQGAGEPITIGERTSIHSEVLGGARSVWVYTPNGYDASEEAYPVVYVLDGNEHFHHTTAIVQFLAAQRRMPDVIVVAIPHTDREGDLTPPTASGTTSTSSTAGGGDRFLGFLRDELVPAIDDTYRTAPYRILIGHSLGGLFAVYAAVTEPGLFHAQIAISPSLWRDDEALVRQAEAFFDRAPATQRGFLYMTLGNERGRMLAGVWGLARVLETRAPDGFRWGFDVFEQEDHGSVPFRSTYAGFRKLYEGWRFENAVEVVADQGLAAVDAHFAALSERFGYDIRTPESVINNIGYGLLWLNRVDDAITVFRSNVERYGRSPNVHDSLGDAYAAAGEWELARRSYAAAVARGREVADPNLWVYQQHLEGAAARVGR